MQYFFGICNAHIQVLITDFISVIGLSKVTCINTGEPLTGKWNTFFQRKKDKNDDSQNSELVDKQKPIMISMSCHYIKSK